MNTDELIRQISRQDFDRAWFVAEVLRKESVRLIFQKKDGEPINQQENRCHVLRLKLQGARTP